MTTVVGAKARRTLRSTCGALAAAILLMGGCLLALRPAEASPPARPGPAIFAHASAEVQINEGNSIDVLESGLTIAIGPEAPVLGVDSYVTLHIRPASGTSWPKGRRPRVLNVQVSAGTVEDLRPDGQEGFRARRVLPTRRAPQGVMVLAHATLRDTSLWAVAFVPLPAMAAPAFHTDPDAEVSMLVGNRLFGPKRANAQGDVRVPIVVDPGVQVALARSTNAHGRMAEETLDLGVPPFQRALLWLPASADHGRPTEFWLFAMNERARPDCAPTFTVFSEKQRAQPLQTGCGWARYLAAAPLLAERPTLEVTAYARPSDQPATGRRPEGPPAALGKVALHPGPAARLLLLPNRSHLLVGSGQRLLVVVRAEDAFGEPTEVGNTRVYVDGVPVTAVRRESGHLQIVVPAPRRARAPRLVVEALSSPQVHGRIEVVLERPAQAVAKTHPEGPEYGWAVLARAGPIASPDMGMGPAFGVEAQHQLLTWSAWPRGLFLTASAAYIRHAEKLVADTGITRVRVEAVPLLLGPTWRLRPLPSFAIFLGMSAGVAHLSAAHESYGITVSGGGWTTAARFSAEGVLGGGLLQLALGASFTDIPGAGVSSRDRLRGGVGGFCLHLGLRRRW